MPTTQPQPQPGIPDNLSAGALRTYFNIAVEWSLPDSAAARLLAVPPNTFSRWKRAPEKARLDAGILERLSYVFGIYKALRILYADDAVGTGWLRRPNTNPTFNGQAPLDRMLAGNVADLYLTRRYLDARRGGW